MSARAILTRSRLLQVAVSVFMALTLTAPTAAQKATWTGTVQYSEGDYFFTETTRSWAFYTGFSLQGSRARFSIGLPVVVQDSRAVTFVGNLPIPTGGPDSEAISGRGPGERVPMGDGRRTSSVATAAWLPPIAGQTTAADTVEAPGDFQFQVADPMLSGGLQLATPQGSFTGLDLSASVKIPLRDVESGVGTGEMDFGATLSTGATVGRAMIFADLGWWSYGDPPGLELKDVVSWGVGVGALLGSRASGIVSLSGASAILDNADPPLDLSGILSLTVSDRTSLVLGAGLGLSEVSPDFTVSAGTRVVLGGRGGMPGT